jgi:DHA2 family metal-tetracycline-proton antiporter-like MFS transporter
MATFVSVMNASMSAIVLPRVQDDFAVKDDTLSWFVTAFLIPFATGTVVYGRLADMYGTRRLLIAGMSLFAVASFAVAAAPTFGAAVAARAVQGFGATAIPALSITTIVRTTQGHARARALGATVLAVGVGFGAGPVAGGALAEVGDWQGPFVATGTAATLLVPATMLTMVRVPGTGRARFDYAGALLLAATVTSALLALNRLPSDRSDTVGLAGAMLAAPLLVALILRLRLARMPFISRAVLRNGRFMAFATIGLTTQGSHFAVVVLLPLLLARYHDMSVIEIGLRLLPGAVALGLSGIAGGFLIERFGTRALLLAGTWVLFNGVMVLHVAGVDWSPAGLAATYAAIATGYGLINASVMQAGTGELPEEAAGVGTGVFTLFFFLGGAISVALAGAILRAREGAVQAWDPFFNGTLAVEFSDAALVVVGLAAVGFVLTMLVGPGEEKAPEPRPEAFRAERPLPGLQPRAKPNKERSAIA